MNEFWTNIARYPRFFISSILGLILIILTPFKTLFKLKRLRIGTFILTLLMVGILIAIIKSMIAL